MMNNLFLFNRQKTRQVQLPAWRRICRAALEKCLATQNAEPTARSSVKRTFNIGVHLVGTQEITRLNETFLRHSGPTDVITFDYCDDAPDGCLSGEIFISVDEAVTQGRRFRTQWQSELVRYLIHGLLHLQGHDDHAPGPRKTMKRHENRLLKELSRRFDWGKLETGKHVIPAK